MSTPNSLQAPPPEVEWGLTKYLDPLRIPPLRKAHDSLEIKLRGKKVQLHSQLPPTPVWTYEGHFPGPTIEVRSGQRLRVAWRNEITSAYPVTAVNVDIPNLTQGPGRDGTKPRPEVGELPAWTVVHLHGARTGAGNDGWTDNAVLKGLAQLAEYPNDQPSATMWYHDHAMAITALTVYSGLAGMYLIRDAEEDTLNLPRGKREIPLIVCDRNLDTDEHGAYTGDLLYKRINLPVAPFPGAIQDSIPATGPFTLVNGVIWPHLDVESRWYRFRVVNASNFRPYTFDLHDEQGAPVPNALYQIGSDSGLLPTPASLDAPTLTLAQRGVMLHPGERADMLIDFRAFRGSSLKLVNTSGPPVPRLTSPNADIMQFRVSSWPSHDQFKLPAKLSPSFKRITPANVHKPHGHRWLALTLLPGQHPEMWEMEPVKPQDVPPNLPVDGIVQIEAKDHNGNIEVKTLKRVSRHFKDAATFEVEEDAWELWNIINLTPPATPVSHPIHVHLIRFQAISRDVYNVSSFGHTVNGMAVGGTTTPLTYTSAGELAPGEQGWKDTVRVDAGTMVSIVGQFGGGSGRFMYHCHILEHEDEGMMRTFVVMPKKVMPFDTGHGHDHDQ